MFGTIEAQGTPVELTGHKLLTAFQHRIERIGLKWRLVFVVVIELIYMVQSRIIMGHADSIAQAEIERTPLRLIAALLFWLTMRDVIATQTVRLETMRNSLFILALSFLFATPILIGGYNASSPDDVILAVTSIPVGLAEELFARGIVQNLCVRRWGIVRGLAMSAVLFLIYHIGVTPDDVFDYGGHVLFALILGLIYLKTGSLLTVMVIHATYDALFSLPRFFSPSEGVWHLPVMVLAALCAMQWYSWNYDDKLR